LRFLFDESVELRIAFALTQHGHNVAVVGIDHPAALSDSDVLRIAHEETRVLVTNDTDFGELAVRQRQAHSGIILIRLSTFSTSAKGERLVDVVDVYSDSLSRFIVISPHGVRIR
jgi:predicted nuclease of predicted toxin-antitoxin system